MQPCESLWVWCYLVILWHKSWQVLLWWHLRNNEQEDSTTNFAKTCNKSNPDLQCSWRVLQWYDCGNNFLLHLQEIYDNFHWPCTNMGHVPFNRFILTVEIWQCSSNGRQFLIKEQELKYTNSVSENLQYSSNHMKIYTTFWFIIREKPIWQIFKWSWHFLTEYIINFSIRMRKYGSILYVKWIFLNFIKHKTLFSTQTLNKLSWKSSI